VATSSTTRSWTGGARARAHPGFKLSNSSFSNVLKIAGLWREAEVYLEGRAQCTPLPYAAEAGCVCIGRSRENS
jgi:hypothetical protein